MNPAPAPHRAPAPPQSAAAWTMSSPASAAGDPAASPASSTLSSRTFGTDSAERTADGSSSKLPAVRRHKSEDTLYNNSPDGREGTGHALISSTWDVHSFPPPPGHGVELLSETFQALHYCWYGACGHTECRAGLEELSPPPAGMLEHRARAAVEHSVVQSYIRRFVTFLDVQPVVLERALRYLRKLRHRIDMAALRTPGVASRAMFAASRAWGTHYLVFATAIMVARKYIEDDSGPRLTAYSIAGGFPKHALRAAERELLTMLNYELF